MSALKSGQELRRRTARPAVAASTLDGGGKLVLPRAPAPPGARARPPDRRRISRRRAFPARSWRRAADRGRAASTAPISAASARRLVQAVTSRLGFAVDQVRVVGHHETSEIDILERLGLDGWTSLIGFDAEAARERIAGLPWVEDGGGAQGLSGHARSAHRGAQAVRDLAAWQRAFRRRAVRQRDRAIRRRPAGDAAAGHRRRRAGAAAAAFIAKIKDASRARGAGQGLHPRRRAALGSAARKRRHRQASRGWRGSGDRPSSSRWTSEDGLLSRDIAAVDMRLPDRLVVQLTPEAARRAQAAMTSEKREEPKRSRRRRYELARRQKRSASPRRSGVVTVLDVGSSKVCCMVARLKPARGRPAAARPHAPGRR